MLKRGEISAKLFVYILFLIIIGLTSTTAQLGQLGVPGESQQSACGNGICEDGETSRTCSHDCKERICPTVCVEMWNLKDGNCVFNACGSGCGPDGTATFKEEAECLLRLAGPKCSDFSAEQCARHDNCQVVSVRKGGQRCIDFVKCAENERLCKQIDCSKFLNNKLDCLVYDKCEYKGKCIDKAIPPEPCPQFAPPYCPDGRLVGQGKDSNGCQLPPNCEPICGNNICEEEEQSTCPQDCGKECPQGFVPGCPIVECIEGYTSVQNPITCCYECKKIAECKTDTDCPQIVCIRAPCLQNTCVNGKCVMSTCGNNVCEEGEDEIIGQTNSIPPSYIIKCPQDCQKKEIEVKVPSSFSLSEGQTAKVVNYQNTKIKLNQIIENVQAVGAGGKIPPHPPPSTTAKITVSSPGGCGPNADPSCLGPPGFSKDYTISEGESIDVQGLKIMFLGINDKGMATFEISTKPACGDNICEEGEVDYCPQDCQECPLPPPCSVPLIYGDPKPGDPNQCPVYTCPSTVCGNGICEKGETANNCLEDCARDLCVNTCGDGVCQERVCLGPGCPCEESSQTCPQDCCPSISPPLQKEGCTYSRNLDEKGCIVGYEERCQSPVPPSCSDLSPEECLKYEDCQIDTAIKQKEKCVEKESDCGNNICESSEDSVNCPSDCCPRISPPLQKEGCTYSRNLDEKGCIVGYEERC